MSCTVTPIQNSDVLTIQIVGTFNFSVQRPFRDAYEGAAENTKHVVVDMAGVDHVDSSALGMLVLMQKAAEEKSVHVSIVNCADGIRRLFQIAHLDAVFQIS